MAEIDYDKLAETIAKIVDNKAPPCNLLSESDIETLKDLVKKKRLMGKGFLWLLVAIAGMLVKDLYQLSVINLRWGP